MDVTVTGLINGTKYYFWLVAGKFPNVVSNMASATPVTVPEAPGGLTATAGNAQATLSWTAPASDDGSQVTGYDLYVGTTADLSANAPVARVTGTVVTVTGLTNGTTYYFRVVAVNAAGQGLSSAEAPATLRPIVPTSPPPTTPTSSTTTSSTTPRTPAGTKPSGFGAPTGLTATPGDARVHLSWAAPASDGGSVISYKVYFASRPGVQESAAIGTAKSTDAIVAGLADGITYYFMVAAVDASGNESPLSAQVASEPITGPTVAVTSPGPPKRLIALLAAVAAMAVAGALTLITRHKRPFGSRKPAHSARSGEQAGVAADVRAVPGTVRPDVVNVRDTGREPTHTVRLEPHPGIPTTTIKEGRP